MFHVRLDIEVTHEERQVEFILLKRQLDQAIAAVQEDKDTETWSCERWAATLRGLLGATSCEVSEDGENGALVVRRFPDVDPHRAPFGSGPEGVPPVR